MRYLQLLSFLAVLIGVAIAPAQAQTISNECLNASSTCNIYQEGQYMSIYGSNMPNDGKPFGYANGDGNTIVVIQTQPSCNPFNNFNQCSEIFVRSDTDTQTFWFESATQLNYYGPFSGSGTGYVLVCRQSGNCTSASPAITLH